MRTPEQACAPLEDSRRRASSLQLALLQFFPKKTDADWHPLISRLAEPE
jgi:hypothetical protein